MALLAASAAYGYVLQRMQRIPVSLLESIHGCRPVAAEMGLYRVVLIWVCHL
jgi:hypothetical protein